MTRDMELVIAILKHLEGRQEISVIEELTLDGYDRSVVAYHLRRLFEAGLLDAEAVVSSTTPSRIVRVLPFGLTWAGHEFLDSLQTPGVFERVRKRLGTELANTPFVVLRDLALTYARTTAGLPE